MKKRLISLFLAVVISVSFVIAGAITATAESELKTSAECVEVLKAEEGFGKYPHWDYGQYTVG